MKIKQNKLFTAIQYIYQGTTIKSLLLASALGLQACGGSGGAQNVEVAAPAFEEPRAGEEDYSMLKAEGTLWVNEQGQKVSLRGINLGNWLAMEMWMFDMSENPLGENIPDQCSLEDRLTERFGEVEKDRLIKLHRDSWITEQDWDVMAEAGFNLIRVPFLYDLIEDDDNPMTVKENAWEYLDWSIEQARQRNMYVVLDLHGAAGRQGWEHHSGCEGLNQLWGSEQYRERTRWIWGQIAARYNGEATVAGYGLLNEPWGTDSQTLRDFVTELYDAVREHDEDHIIILPGHNADDIQAYNDPLDWGMENVAFEMHFYPGIFGWGEIGYHVHRDWLTCGASGTAGVCDWSRRLRNVYTPMLIGELQPWTGLGELGGEITRATFDRYNELNWAATAWSIKTTSPSGGVGNGTWGLLTNVGDQLLTKAETWSCNDWESSFDNACAVSARSTIPYVGAGSRTMYLVVKTGSFNGTDVTYDDLALVQDSTGEDILLNGEFGSADNWTEVAVWGDPRTYDFNYDAGEFAGSDNSPSLRVTADAGHNSLIYQAVEIIGGESYTLSGKFKDNGEGGQDMWAEVYLVPEEPTEFVDVNGRVLPQVDINTSSLEDIENFFASFATMEYVANPHVMESLQAENGASVFTNIPEQATNLAISVSAESIALSWDASNADASGYKVYRSTSPRSGFSEIADVDGLSYSDTDIVADTTYYYYIAAYNSTDESYASDIVASGETFFTLPGRIEAENYTDAHPGVNTEGASDIGGGFNIGSFEPGRWVEYEIYVETAGTYTIDYRLASLVGNVEFAVQVGNEVLDTVPVPNTEGWQSYVDVMRTITLPEGRSTLRLESIDNQWNLNWFEVGDIVEGDPEPEPTVEPTPEPTATPEPVYVDHSFDNPSSGTGGSNATVTIVNDADKAKDVVSLEVLANDGVDEGYASISFASQDFTPYAALEFDVKDTVGNNNPYLELKDSSGATWGIWVGGNAVNGTWTTMRVDFTDAADAIDLSDVVEITVAEWNAGIYYLSDFTLKASAGSNHVIANPSSGTGGSNTTVTIVNNAEKAKDVVSLEVLSNDDVDNAFASITFDEVDLRSYSRLQFDILDTVGSNTAHIVLKDADGATWSAWASDASVQDTWTTIAFDYSGAMTSIDLSRVVEITVAQWNAGTYYLSDLTFIATPQ